MVVAEFVDAAAEVSPGTVEQIVVDSIVIQAVVAADVTRHRPVDPLLEGLLWSPAKSDPSEMKQMEQVTN